MEDFDAGSFSDIAATLTGVALWKLLNEPDSLIRLETATYLERPALEALQPQLVAKFGDTIRTDRWKQMIGRMARQVMLSHGYTLDRAGVRIRRGELFSSAARYKKL